MEQGFWGLNNYLLVYYAHAHCTFNTLQRVSCMKILSVHVDSNLIFKEHISSVSNKVSKNVAFLKRMKCCINVCKNNFLLSFIQPFLDYVFVLLFGARACFNKSRGDVCTSSLSNLRSSTYNRRDRF